MIIGINGYAGSGKDTIGIIIQFLNSYATTNVTLEELIENYKQHQWWLEEQSGWEIKKWAGKLKQIASILTGLPQEKFEDQEFKKTNLGSEWSTELVELIGPNTGNPYDRVVKTERTPMTVRDFLQKLGTEGLRTGLHTNTWVNALMAEYKESEYVGSDSEGEDIYIHPNWVITDTRFPNEAQAIKDAGGIVIRVDRPGVSAINAHASEIGLDNWDFDYKIMNGSDLAGLMFTVNTILRKENIMHEKDKQPAS